MTTRQNTSLQPFTKRFGFDFWSRVITNAIVNLLGLTIWYLWIKSHGGFVILPW